MSQAGSSRTEWRERAAAKVAAAQEVLEREVAAIQSGDDWRQYLDLQSRLHAYSPNNVLLLCRQHAEAYAEGRVPAPELTYVAGFRTWQALGRQVERGQHGYAVLAPVRRAERYGLDETGNVRRLGRDDDPDPSERVQVRQVLRGFTVEHVFDVSQTCGELLPVPPRPRLLEGEAPAGLGQAVLELVESRGWRVDTVPDASYLRGANGQASYSTRTILIRSDMDDAAMVKTAIHEVAHALMHQDAPGIFLPRATKEVEAESVAFVVSAAHGMPTDDYSFPYVAGWAGAAGIRAVAETQTRVARTAKVILEVSPAEHTTGGKVPRAEAALAAARQAGLEAARLAEPPAMRADTGVEVA